MFRILNDGYAIPPVEPDELMFAFAVADAAASFRMPVPNPAVEGLNLYHDDGTETKVLLSDRPVNRAGLAIAEHFRGDKFCSIVVRLFALHGMLKEPECSRWVRESSPGRKEISESLFAAAARAPLRARRFKFDIEDMIRLATEHDQENGFDT